MPQQRRKLIGLDMGRQQDRAVGAIAERLEAKRILSGEDTEALRTQAQQLEHVMFAGCTHPAAVDLAERLVALLPRGLSRVFYSDNGSTAVEVAVKMAMQYWINAGAPRLRDAAPRVSRRHGRRDVGQ